MCDLIFWFYCIPSHVWSIVMLFSFVPILLHLFPQVHVSGVGGTIPSWIISQGQRLVPLFIIADGRCCGFPFNNFPELRIICLLLILGGISLLLVWLLSWYNNYPHVSGRGHLCIYVTEFWSKYQCCSWLCHYLFS